MLLFLYNILLLLIGGTVVAIASGWQEALVYLNWVFSTSQNRFAAGGIGVIIVVLGVIGVIGSLKRRAVPQSITIENGFNGQVSISFAAIKVIIMKAVKQVEGVKDIRTSLKSSPEGILVTLQMMVNPELSVPELTRSIQQMVKDYLQNIGGLQVAEVKVLVDDFSTAEK